MNTDLLEKLKKLMEQGTQGERDNATKILQKILKKEGKTLEEYLSDSEVEQENMFVFSWKNIFERQLFLQTLSFLFELKGLRGKWYKNKIHIILPKSKYIELEMWYETLVYRLNEEIEITVSAFIQRNRLFSKENSKPDPTQKLTEQDLRMLKRASTMDRVEIRKQIEC